MACCCTYDPPSLRCLYCHRGDHDHCADPVVSVPVSRRRGEPEARFTPEPGWSRVLAWATVAAVIGLILGALLAMGVGYGVGLLM